jgi:hypothetical protein
MPQTLDRDRLITDRQANTERRPELRREVMALRATRRVKLGDQLVLEFENADTLQYQVQEMVYAEGLTEAADVAHEVESYSRLLPSSHELCATLFIELDEVATVREELSRLTGVQHHLWIEVGGHRAPAQELPGPDEDGPSEATYSVHFLRFHFDDAARDAFRDPEAPAELVVEHAEYAESVPLAGATRLSLLADLSL